MQRAHEFENIRAVNATFDAERALPRRRQTFFGREDRGDAVGESEALESGGCEYDRRILAIVQFFQTRLHIPAQWFDHEMGKARAYLTFAAQSRRADAT